MANNDVFFFQKVFFDNYRAVINTPFTVYPRITFHTLGMPSPRQYYAYYKLIKQGFANDESFLSSELTLANTATDNIVVIDNYRERVFKGIIEGKKLVNEKRYQLFLTSGFFYRGSSASRRSKMIEFLRNLAKKGVELYIHTQDEDLEKDFFNCSDEEKKMLQDVHIIWTYYRIDIHYIILLDLENKANSHFFLEYPHSEHHIYRLDIHFTYNEIKEKYNGDPEKVFNYLLKLREGDPMEKFFYHLLKRFPKLRNHIPDRGIAFGF